MAGDNAEPTRSASGDLDSSEAERPRGKRQRAVDLFSPHRYRQLQLSAFERRGKGAGDDARGMPAEEPYAGEDDVVDPPLDSSAPAAVAARAQLPGDDVPTHDGPLEPVPYSEGVQLDPEALEVGDVVPQDAAMDGQFTPTRDVPWPDAEDTADFGLPDEAFRFPEDGDGWAGTDDADGEGATEEIASPGKVGTLDESGPLTEEGRTRKGGRNLPVATAVGIALLALAVAAAWVHPLVFAGVLYTFAIGALIEWKRALAKHGRRIPLVPLVAATLGLGVATWFAKPEGLVVALLVGCAGVVAWRIGDERVENTLADALAGVLTLLWIPFLASFLFLLEIADDGWMRVVIVVLAVVGNDTGGLIAGMYLGRHKLLERVSPKKTWEGAAGGAVLGTVAAAVAAFFFFDGDWHIGATVGFACTVAAVVGDLAESALKRDIHIKDMSSIIPGHGGILDRIDSLLFAAPVGYVVFAIFLGTLGGGGL